MFSKWHEVCQKESLFMPAWNVIFFHERRTVVQSGRTGGNALRAGAEFKKNSRSVWTLYLKGQVLHKLGLASSSLEPVRKRLVSFLAFRWMGHWRRLWIKKMHGSKNSGRKQVLQKKLRVNKTLRPRNHGRRELELCIFVSRPLSTSFSSVSPPSTDFFSLYAVVTVRARFFPFYK
jgi:hypothetical protein